MATSSSAQSVFAQIKVRETKSRVFSFEEYLNFAKQDEWAYASIHQRLLKAIGNPTEVNTRDDSRLGRIFMNRKVKMYDAFSDFYGADMITTIERVVGFLTYAAQGLEESKQILYLLGPVGSAKSSLAERIKILAEKYPIYVLAYEKNGERILSPLYESPLGLIPQENAKVISRDYNIPDRHFTGIMSPWAVKRLRYDMDGDITKFKVVEVYPSRLKQIGIAKTEPGDDNNQDISSLVGKADLRKLEDYSTDDPDAYSFSGSLCKATQGVMEFVEMFKAPIKTLHPLLTATQDGHYAGSEPIGEMPHQGLILAHSNEQEWVGFKNNKKNEAFLDRIRRISVGYNLRLTEEQDIFRKKLRESALAEAPIAPYALEFLGRIAVGSRLVPHDSSTLITKLRVYDGQNLKDEDPKAISHQEYIEVAGLDEGFSGLSTRFTFKVLSEAFNTDDEIALDVIKLVQVLKRDIREERLDEEKEKRLLGFIDEQVKQWYFERLDEHIKEALIENLQGYAQNRFERYFAHADAWVQDADYQDPHTRAVYSRDELNQKLAEIEKPAGISNPKDFRHEVTGWVLRNRQNRDQLPRWDEFEKMAKVIRKVVAKNTEDLLPILSFDTKRDSETEQKFQTFLSNMQKLGYTELQTRHLVAWHQKMNRGK